MGEFTNPPEETDVNEDSVEDDDNVMQDEEDDLDELTSEELVEIDSKLDALNLALDKMETKNEEIHQQLIELLQSSRKIREELKQEQAMNSDCSHSKKS